MVREGFTEEVKLELGHEGWLRIRAPRWHTGQNARAGVKI